MSADKSRNLVQRDDLLNIIVAGAPDGSTPGLSKYFVLGTPEGLVSMLLDAGVPGVAPTGDPAQSELASAAADALGPDPVTRNVKRLVLDTVKGAHVTRDFAEEVVQLLGGVPAEDEAFLRVLSVFGSADVSSKLGFVPLNSVLRIPSTSPINSGAPTKETPGLSAYVVKPIGISPGTKNTAALALFMNAIPTVELNRAVPFVDLTLQVGRAPVSVDGRLSSPSQLKFVLGASTVKAGSADFSMMTAARATLDDGGVVAAEDATAVAGMELFLSPQTMVSVSGQGGSGFIGLDSPSLRPTPVLDPFRPLMSLEKVSIDIAASQGFMSFKTANVELVCHDRSRLHEVADFVKPDLFSKTEFLMEYGWHHPDGFEYDRNPFGALLNAMRVREKYGIVNSSFQFEDNGAVRITLQLAMKGANEYRTVQVGTDTEVHGALREVADLQERVAEVRSAINSSTLGGKRHGKSVFGEQLLEAAQTTLGTPTITDKQRRKLRAIVESLRRLNDTNGRAKELADVLTELYIQGPEGGKSAVDRLQSSVKRVIEDKFKALDGFSPTQVRRQDGIEAFPDVTPAGDVVIDPFIDLKRVTDQDLRAAGKTSRFVSFGKVFMKFVAEPIASTGRFDEVQVLFYPMNNGAGAARNKSVASFLIDRGRLKSEFEAFVLERRADNITVGEFQNWLNQTFIDNVSNPSYGMTTNYRPQRDRDGEVRIVANLKGVSGRGAKERNANWATELEQKLVHMGVPNGTFRPPQVDLHIEALPARVPLGGEGQTRDFQDERTVLRIHVFDKAATAYETQGELVRALADAQLNTVGFMEPGSGDDEGRQEESARRIIAAAEKLGVLEEIPSNEAAADEPQGPTQRHFRIRGGPQELKRFVMSTAPYIIYGGQSSAVESFGMASIQDPELSTVNMIRSDRAGSVTPEGSGRGGVPLKTIPARVEMTSLGCPLLSFMQSFFVDAQTGTDLDNIYSITSLSHTIDATTFKSSFDMVPVQAFGRYESTLNKVEQALGELAELTRGSAL